MTSHIKSLNIEKKKTYDIRNPGPDLVHAHICGKSRDRHTYVTIVNVLC